jgi:hypothetical protein
MALAYVGLLNIGKAPTTYISGIVEADETRQRDSRKGSREWFQQFADLLNVAKPPRSRWENYTTLGLKMMPDLSK